MKKWKANFAAPMYSTLANALYPGKLRLEHGRKSVQAWAGVDREEVEDEDDVPAVLSHVLDNVPFILIVPSRLDHPLLLSLMVPV